MVGLGDVSVTGGGGRGGVWGNVWALMSWMSFGISGYWKRVVNDIDNGRL
jgi:hypothetical protein